jgi:hypothetical protein
MPKTAKYHLPLHPDHLEQYVAGTIGQLISDGVFPWNSWAITVDQVTPEGRVVIWKLNRTLETLEGVDLVTNKASHYAKNVKGKAFLCQISGMDSRDAVHHRKDLLVTEGVFPYGGGVYDLASGLIVAVSGFEADEDHWKAQDVLNLILMHKARAGDAAVKASELIYDVGNGNGRFIGGVAPK